MTEGTIWNKIPPANQRTPNFSHMNDEKNKDNCVVLTVILHIGVMMGIIIINHNDDYYAWH